jgi:hypothetical protein
METDAPERTTIPASAVKGEGLEIQLQRLARWACGLRFEDLPADVVQRAKVILMLQDGSVETATCINAPGDPVTPLSMDCLRARFTELAEDALGSVDATRIIAAIFDLNGGGPVSELRESMRRPVRET